MSSAWPLVALGEILTHDREYIDAPEARMYPKLSVKLYGIGGGKPVAEPEAAYRTIRQGQGNCQRAYQAYL